MLGLDNPIHILFLLAILLLVFGAKRLPEMGKSLGEGLRGFKDSITGETPVTHMTSTTDPTRVDALPVATTTPVTTAMPVRVMMPDATAIPTDIVSERVAEWASEASAEGTPMAPAA